MFVDIRKRLGSEQFDQFNDAVIRRAEKLRPARKRIIKKPCPGGQEGKDDSGKDQPEAQSGGSTGKKDPFANQGILKLDASVADQYITYPTDLKLINRAREETDRLIDVLYAQGVVTGSPGLTAGRRGSSTWVCRERGGRARKNFGRSLAGSCGM